MSAEGMWMVDCFQHSEVFKSMSTGVWTTKHCRALHIKRLRPVSLHGMEDNAV